MDSTVRSIPASICLTSLLIIFGAAELCGCQIHRRKRKSDMGSLHKLGILLLFSLARFSHGKTVEIKGSCSWLREVSIIRARFLGGG